MLSRYFEGLRDSGRIIGVLDLWFYFCAAGEESHGLRRDAQLHRVSSGHLSRELRQGVVVLLLCGLLLVSGATPCRFLGTRTAKGTC